MVRNRDSYRKMEKKFKSIDHIDALISALGNQMPQSMAGGIYGFFIEELEEIRKKVETDLTNN